MAQTPDIFNEFENVTYSPEVAFSQKTSAAILVLLGFLIILNLVAIILRKKFERKW